MAEFFADMRDIRFNLFDLFDVGAFQKSEYYKDADTETINDILDAAEQQAREVFFPCNEAGDRIGARLENGKVIMPPGFKEAYDTFSESGWLSLAVRPEHGGQGFPFLAYIATEELFSAANINLMFTPGLSHGTLGLMHEYGTDAQKKIYADKLLTGEWAGTMCLTEPSVGTAVPDLESSATPIEGKPGFYKIKGQKIFISSGDHELTDNIVHLFLARIDGDPMDHRGISLFIVPKYKVDENGKIGEPNDVVCVGLEKKLGIHGSATAQLSFGDEGHCEGWLIGERGGGLKAMFKMMNEARIAVGLQGVSLANLSYQRAVRYAKERIQGTAIDDRREDAPRVPIIAHPDVRRMLLHMKASAEGTRALMFYAAYCLDRASMATDEKEAKHWHYQVEVLTPIVKAYCSDEGFTTCSTGIQVLGGYGYISEYGQEQLLRDVKIAAIYEGTNGIQAMDLIGRKMGRGGGVMMMALLNEVNKTLNSDAKTGVFADEIAAVAKSRDVLAGVAMSFAQYAQKKDINYPALHGVNVLQIFGDVLTAWLLVRQAIKAESMLSTYLEGKGISREDEGYRDFLENDNEARFLNGKIETMRFFVNQILPRARARAASIKSEDRSALTMVF